MSNIDARKQWIVRVKLTAPRRNCIFSKSFEIAHSYIGFHSANNGDDY